MIAARKNYPDHAPRPVEAVNTARSQEIDRKFLCPEESTRYAASLEQMVFSRLRGDRSGPTVIEFGSGSGSPVVAAILNSGFSGTVHGYEINPVEAEAAAKLIEQNRLGRKYAVYHESFFESAGVPRSDYLIANPPYLPCRNEDRALLTLPGLCGGIDGIDVSKRLLSSGYQNVFLEVSSYSNPVALIDHARSLGYRVSDFMITQMPLGIYSRQDIVRTRILEMRAAGTAFLTDKCYLVGSAFFSKTADAELDLSSEFQGCLTSLGRL